jgi:hypothetical protein
MCVPRECLMISQFTQKTLFGRLARSMTHKRDLPHFQIEYYRLLILGPTGK